MENNMEKEEAIIAEIKAHKGLNTEQIAHKFEVTPDYVHDLEILEKVLRLNKWDKETQQILKSNNRNFKFAFSKIAIAATLLIFAGISFLALDKHYLTDIIVENEEFRKSKEEINNKVKNPQELAFQDFVNGKAYYYSKDYKNAIKNYLKVLQTPNLRNHFREAVMWHLCVAYLQNNDLKNCGSVLDKIESNKNPKYEINELDLLKLKTQLWLKQTF
jgi:hypothetical protein